jgi:predicted O-methyltransferase YrrM
MLEVLSVTVYKHAAIRAHVLRVPAAEIRVREQDTQSMHRRLKAPATDVELDAALLRLLLRLHGLNLAVQLGALAGDLGSARAFARSLATLARVTSS